MISKKMETALNEQIGMEGYASFLYLSMASWCAQEGLEGCSNFLYRQSDEERIHMLKIFRYINEVDGHARVPAIAEAPIEFESVQAMFKLVYEHEQRVTRAINNLVALSYEEKDHTTLNFLQWYVTEQREEEALMRSILDRIRLIGEGSRSLYYIDKEVDQINRETMTAEAEA